MLLSHAGRRVALVAANLTTVGALTAATLMATTGDPAPPVERPAGAHCYATDVP